MAEIGYISRGADLIDKQQQERYFAQLQRQYLRICADSPSVDSLRQSLQKLSFDPGVSESEPEGSVTDGLGDGVRGNSDVDKNIDTENVESKVTDINYMDKKGTETKESQFDQILVGLRKLRETVLASGPPTSFSKIVFLFSARVTVLLGHYQSYLPSLKTLLDVIDPVVPLTTAERYEIAGLYVLHLTHFANDPAAAFDALYRYNIQDDLPLRQIIISWTDKDYVLWRTRYKAESDNARRKLMDHGARNMAIACMKTIGSAYFFMSKTELEGLVGYCWDQCLDLGCRWRLENDRVVIRQRK
ncbi:uncharacterized protein V1516DRAFT_673795 [Lipomyces oligophaga]|uniref:uncharacterized protein n=1 Tax=Lipomyces oligophaga TaxID=45792 RepID=UPI0034CFB68A